MNVFPLALNWKTLNERIKVSESRIFHLFINVWNGKKYLKNKISNRHGNR